MDIKLAIEIGVLFVTIVGAWYGLKGQVDGLKESIKSVKETLDEDICVRLSRIEDSGTVATSKRAEEGALHAHRRLDDHERRLIRVESEVAHQTEGFARVEKSIADLTTKVEGLFGALSRRIDEALKPGASRA
jgi:hypothetical protein